MVDFVLEAPYFDWLILPSWPADVLDIPVLSRYGTDPPSGGTDLPNALRDRLTAFENIDLAARMLVPLLVLVLVLLMSP